MSGNFSFDEVESEGAFGIVFLASFLLVNMVLMLNLLIAILSSTYAHLEQKGVALYL